jgi:hypothetical protein
MEPEPLGFKLPPPEPTPQAPPLGLMIGLGPLWDPGAPRRYRWADLTGPAGDKLHALIIDGVDGSAGLVLDAADLAELGRQATERSTGLSIASSLQAAR